MLQMPKVSTQLAIQKSEVIANGVMVDYLGVPDNHRIPFSTTLFEVAPGHATPIDQHQVAELWIVIKGSGLLSAGDQSCRISQGSSVYFPSQMAHQIHNDRDDILQVYSIYW